jgi:hypothetical protein
LEQRIELFRVEDLVFDDMCEQLLFKFLHTFFSDFLKSWNLVVELQHLLVELFLLPFFLLVFKFFFLIARFLEDLPLVVLLTCAVSDFIVFFLEIHCIRIDLRNIDVYFLYQILLFVTPTVACILHIVFIVFWFHLCIFLFIVITVLIINAVFLRD